MTRTAPTAPNGLFLRSPPPKKKTKFANIEIAPAMVAVIRHYQRIAILHMRKLMREHAGELFLIESLEQSVVAQTAACSGSRPVANAFG